MAQRCIPNIYRLYRENGHLVCKSTHICLDTRFLFHKHEFCLGIQQSHYKEIMMYIQELAAMNLVTDMFMCMSFIMKIRAILLSLLSF